MLQLLTTLFAFTALSISAPTATTTISSSPHHGPNAPLDINLVYRGPGNANCNGYIYHVDTFSGAEVCKTLANPIRTFQIGTQPSSQQLMVEKAGGCRMLLYSSTDCSDGYLGLVPDAVGNSTYGTCYTPSAPALSAMVGCSP